jgi:hypothetical protein
VRGLGARNTISARDKQNVMDGGYLGMSKLCDSQRANQLQFNHVPPSANRSANGGDAQAWQGAGIVEHSPDNAD